MCGMSVVPLWVHIVNKTRIGINQRKKTKKITSENFVKILITIRITPPFKLEKV